MPFLSRLFIKTSLGYLGLALLVGVVLAAGPLAGAGRLAAFYFAYVHLFVVGWLTQLIFGVAFWLFPRFSRERPYGSERVPWLTYLLLNAGLLLRVGAEPVVLLRPGSAAGVVLAVSALLQWLAGLLFAGYLWRRVKRK
jgi:hypothetical protein